jgi:putative oxidoreductase
MNNLIFLRVGLIIVMLTHSLHSIWSLDVNNFGALYLDKIGFSPLGVPLAWAVKLSHVACALALILDKYVKIMSGITIFILLVGIFMVHLPSGWFVVGGGTNGIEYNVFLIFGFLTIMFKELGIKN